MTQALRLMRNTVRQELKAPTSRIKEGVEEAEKINAPEGSNVQEPKIVLNKNSSDEDIRKFLEQSKNVSVSDNNIKAIRIKLNKIK